MFKIKVLLPKQYNLFSIGSKAFYKNNKNDFNRNDNADISNEKIMRIYLT